MNEFSPASYRAILTAFVESGYRVMPLGERFDDSDRVVYLRHDVDYSLELASRLGRVNREHGVAGCFFLLHRGPLYNLANEFALEHVESLLADGQEIGLHFHLPRERPAGALDRSELSELIHTDFELLQTLVAGRARPVFSWHNPSLLDDESGELVRMETDGLVNAYALNDRGFHYIADSNHRHSVDHWLATARAGHERVHALFHPIQWVFETDTMEEVLARTWLQCAGELELLFSTNHVFRARFPDGLPPEPFEAVLGELLESIPAKVES